MRKNFTERQVIESVRTEFKVRISQIMTITPKHPRMPAKFVLITSMR